MEASLRGEHGVGNEMEADAFGEGGTEVTTDSIGGLLLKVAEVAALRGDTAALRIIPGGDQLAGILARLHLKQDFIHGFSIALAAGIVLPRRVGGEAKYTPRLGTTEHLLMQ